MPHLSCCCRWQAPFRHPNASPHCDLASCSAALEDQTGLDPQHSGNWESAWSALLWSFVAAGAYSLLANFLPWIKAFPVFTWVGLQVQYPALVVFLLRCVWC